MRERVEERIDEILAPYFDAIRSAVVHATYEGEVLPSQHPDLGARIAAAEKVLNRVYGKPRQVQEVTGEGGGPVEVSGDLADPEIRRLAHELLRRRVESGGDES